MTIMRHPRWCHQVECGDHPGAHPDERLILHRLTLLTGDVSAELQHQLLVNRVTGEIIEEDEVPRVYITVVGLDQHKQREVQRALHLAQVITDAEIPPVQAA